MASFLLAAAAYADLEDVERYTLATWGEEQRVRYITGLFSQFELPRTGRISGTPRARSCGAIL
jgi:plasmid stabilization system protein ParE